MLAAAVTFATLAAAPRALLGEKVSGLAERMSDKFEERQECGSDRNGPNAGVNCGCFDSASHSCDCNVPTAGACELKGVGFSWSQDCNSCHPVEPDTCGTDGQGENCGCYFLRSPEAVAGAHSCACHLKTKESCEAVMGPFQGIWTAGCNSCFEDEPSAPLSCGGDFCGCYYLSAPDAIAQDHSCRCDFPDQESCESSWPLAIWTSGCESCYTE